MSRKSDDILGHLVASKVVAVVRLDNGDQLVQVAEALLAGGITTIEFTVSTPGALDMIQAATDRFGDRVLMGAGTVLDPETARIRLCKRYGKPIMPGAFTPTEILAAWEAGGDIIKVFPASQAGGPAYLKAVLAPLPQIRLAPTGGVSSANAADYLQAGAVAVGVGGKLVDKGAVAISDWAAITAEAQALMLSIATD